MVDAQDIPATDQAAVKSVPTPTPAEAFKGRVAECVAILQRGVRSNGDEGVTYLTQKVF